MFAERQVLCQVYRQTVCGAAAKEGLQECEHDIQRHCLSEYKSDAVGMSRRGVQKEVEGFSDLGGPPAHRASSLSTINGFHMHTPALTQSHDAQAAQSNLSSVYLDLKLVVLLDDINGDGPERSRPPGVTGHEGSERVEPCALPVYHHKGELPSISYV